LDLNRVYLSAGVYGVETMSQHLFPEDGQRRHPAGGGVSRRADSCTVGVVALVNYDGALERSPRGAVR